MKLKPRDQELKSIIRYKQNSVCKPMYYTPNLWIHVQRVTWLAQWISKQLWVSERIRDRVTRVAMFHDDSEIVAWDIATPVKQNWSPEEKSEYEAICSNAIPILVENYWDELWDDYEEILKEMESSQSEWIFDETSLIHAIIEYADKLDALMEVTHELYSWNDSFLKNLWETYGFNVNWFEYVLNRVKRRRSKIEKLLEKDISDIWYFNIIQQDNLDLKAIVSTWEKFTRFNIKKTTGNEIYDIWKNLHFYDWRDEKISVLYSENIT